LTSPFSTFQDSFVGAWRENRVWTLSSLTLTSAVI
jgi:hypothetical protein